MNKKVVTKALHTLLEKCHDCSEEVNMHLQIFEDWKESLQEDVEKLLQKGTNSLIVPRTPATFQRSRIRRLPVIEEKDECENGLMKNGQISARSMHVDQNCMTSSLEEINRNKETPQSPYLLYTASVTKDQDVFSEIVEDVCSEVSRPNLRKTKNSKILKKDNSVDKSENISSESFSDPCLGEVENAAEVKLITRCSQRISSKSKCVKTSICNVSDETQDQGEVSENTYNNGLLCPSESGQTEEKSTSSATESRIRTTIVLEKPMIIKETPPNELHTSDMSENVEELVSHTRNVQKISKNKKKSKASVNRRNTRALYEAQSSDVYPPQVSVGDENGETSNERTAYRGRSTKILEQPIIVQHMPLEEIPVNVGDSGKLQTRSSKRLFANNNENAKASNLGVHEDILPDERMSVPRESRNSSDSVKNNWLQRKKENNVSMHSTENIDSDASRLKKRSSEGFENPSNQKRSCHSSKEVLQATDSTDNKLCIIDSEEDSNDEKVANVDLSENADNTNKGSYLHNSDNSSADCNKISMILSESDSDEIQEVALPAKVCVPKIGPTDENLNADQLLGCVSNENSKEYFLSPKNKDLPKNQGYQNGVVKNVADIKERLLKTTKRVTRSKARAIAASGNLVLPVYEMNACQDLSCHRKSARASVKKAIKTLAAADKRKQASKENPVMPATKKHHYTPLMASKVLTEVNTSAHSALNSSKKTPLTGPLYNFGSATQPLKSAIKINNIYTNVETFIKKPTKTVDTEDKKLGDLKRREEKENQAIRRREELLRIRAEEQKKKKEEQRLKVLQNREARERERQEMKERVGKEKSEKLHNLLQEREEQKKGNVLKKKQEMEKRAADAKRKIEEAEAARVAKLKQEELLQNKAIEEAEKEALRRLAEEKEAAILRERMEQKVKELAQLKQKNQLQKNAIQIHNLNSTWDQPPISAVIKTAKVIHEEAIDNGYFLDDLISDKSDDDEDCPKKKTAKWAKRSRLLQESHLQVQLASKINKMVISKKVIDISEMFPNKRLKRTSSAKWDTPPRYSCLPKY